MFKWININQHDKKKKTFAVDHRTLRKFFSNKKEITLKPTSLNLFCELNCDSTSHQNLSFTNFTVHIYLYNSLEVKERDTIQSGSFRI